MTPTVDRNMKLEIRFNEQYVSINFFYGYNISPRPQLKWVYGWGEIGFKSLVPGLTLAMIYTPVQKFPE